jgi:hypothetical protein
VEEAERCLIKLLPTKKNSRFTLDATRRDAARDQSYLFPVTIEKSLLDFQTRHLTLGRWSLPVMRTGAPSNPPKEGPQTTKPYPTNKDDDLGYVRTQVTEMLKKSARSPTPPKKRQAGEHEWAFTPQDRLMARFGQRLFPLDSLYVGPQSTATAAFVASLPGLANLLTDEGFRPGNRPSAPILEYTFIAAPEQPNFLKDQDFPALNVQFRYNERTGQHYLQQLSLGFEEHIHDVLLPSRSLDIRFYKNTWLPLLAPCASKMMAGFIQTVLANIQSGEKLTAPNLVIDIPKWTIPGYAQAHSPGTRSVKYLFTGTSFRQSVAASLLDQQVAISTVQSGKLGEKGISLSIFYDPKQPDDSSRHERDPMEKQGDALTAFLRGCFKIVDKITEAAASHQAVNKGAKLRNEFSARKLRRQGLGDVAMNGVAEQEGASVVAGNAEQDLAEPAPIQGDNQSKSTLSQLTAQDMDDPYLVGILSEGTSPGQQDEPPFTHQETLSLKAVA